MKHDGGSSYLARYQAIFIKVLKPRWGNNGGIEVTDVLSVAVEGLLLWFFIDLRKSYTPEGMLSSKLPADGGAEVKDKLDRLRAIVRDEIYTIPELS